MKPSTPLWTFALIGGLFLSACSTTKPIESSNSLPSTTENSSGILTPPPHIADSSVEIEYFLGRDHYRYLAKQKDSVVSANTILAGQVLEDGLVDQEQYSRFLKSAISVLNGNQQSTPSHDVPCRSPFKLTVRIGNEMHTIHGCRSTDKGALSKLIKEGEFLLLYSKN